MATKIKDITDCRSRHDFIEYAKEYSERSEKLVVSQRGKFAKLISTNGNCAELYDDPRDLPKSARATFINWFKTLGLIAVLLAALGGYLVMQHPEIVAAVSAHAGG